MTDAGLGYFADFLPLAGRLEPMDRTVADVHARYVALAGLETAALGQDAAVLRHALAEAEIQFAEQVRHAQALPEYWRGDAAERAHEAMLSNLAGAEQTLSAIRTALDALGAAQETVSQVLMGRTDAISCFPAGVDGCAADQVARMIDDVVAAARPSPEAAADENSQRWLSEVFVPHVREQLDIFDDICRAAETAIGATLGVVADALAAVGDAAASTTPAPTRPPAAMPDPSLDPGLDRLGAAAVSLIADSLVGAGKLAHAVGEVALAVGGAIASELGEAEDEPQPDVAPNGAAEATDTATTDTPADAGAEHDPPAGGAPALSAPQPPQPADPALEQHPGQTSDQPGAPVLDEAGSIPAPPRERSNEPVMVLDAPDRERPETASSPPEPLSPAAPPTPAAPPKPRDSGQPLLAGAGDAPPEPDDVELAEAGPL